MDNEAGTEKLLSLIDSKNRSRIEINLKKTRKQYGGWGWQRGLHPSEARIVPLVQNLIKPVSWATSLFSTQHSPSAHTQHYCFSHIFYSSVVLSKIRLSQRCSQPVAQRFLLLAHQLGIHTQQALLYNRCLQAAQKLTGAKTWVTGPWVIWVGMLAVSKSLVHNVVGSNTCRGCSGQTHNHRQQPAHSGGLLQQEQEDNDLYHWRLHPSNLLPGCSPLSVRKDPAHYQGPAEELSCWETSGHKYVPLQSPLLTKISEVKAAFSYRDLENTKTRTQVKRRFTDDEKVSL